MVSEAQLERVIMSSTLPESEVPRVPRVEQDCHALNMAHATQVDSLLHNLSQVSGPTLLTKAWKRLTREVGMVSKDKILDNGAVTVGNIINSGKKRLSIDFKDHMESKKFCMETSQGEVEQTFEVVAARQHHQAL